MFEGCKYILWDWNGTLLNDVKVNLDTVDHMLKDRGITTICSEEFYREHFCFPVIDFYHAVGFDFSNETFEHAAEDYVMWYNRLFSEARLFEETTDTLEAVKRSGIKQIILSATNSSNLSSQVEYFGIENYFEAMLGVSDSLGSGKIDIAMQWMNKAGLSPEDVVMIGDTDHDFAVSQALGCSCVLISSGHQSKSILKKTGGLVVESIGDIVKLIGEGK